MAEQLPVAEPAGDAMASPFGDMGSPFDALPAFSDGSEESDEEEAAAEAAGAGEQSDAEGADGGVTLHGDVRPSFSFGHSQALSSHEDALIAAALDAEMSGEGGSAGSSGPPSAARLAQLAAITPEALNPEELTLIDPACGSGHLLVEAYELFKAIEARQREQQVILELSNAAGDYNNQPLERQLDGVATPVPNKLVLNKIVEFKLQRPLGSDFDDF